MKKRGKAKRKHLVQKVKFFLGENQTLYVSPGVGTGPGLCRIFVTRKNGRVSVWADATSGSHFRFRRGRGNRSDPDFQIVNLDSGEAIEDILDRKFWGQFTWGQIFAYGEDKSFGKKVKQRIKQLVEEFEEHAAKELNAIPRPKRSKPSRK